MLDTTELSVYFSNYDLKRLEMYANKLADYHLIVDLVPHIARIYFMYKMPNTKLSLVQQVGLYITFITRSWF